jgi:two-component system, OmpR family, alkaline phosphatase synthesis response regulator PhoP
MKNDQAPVTILLVEDEESLAIGLEYNLREEGYEVIRAADGAEAVARFDADHVDLVILDIMLPRMNGFKVAEHIRENSPRVPIMMLTARSAPSDRVRGLEIGADDYLAKPFHLEELLLRVRGMLRRKTWYEQSYEEAEEFTFSGIAIDFARLRARVGDADVRITPLEGMLLRYFTTNSHRIISRKELLEKVWQSTSDLETRTVDNFILRLRKYFEPDPAKPVFFRSVRGAGYMFCPDGIEP